MNSKTEGEVKPRQANMSLQKFVFLIMLSLCFNACLDPTEDCLDPLATNFNAAADDGCDDCCDFPELTINFEHNMGEVPLTLGLDYTTDSLHYFSFINLRYFLSEVEVSGPDLQLEYLDSFAVSVVENGATVNKQVKDNLAFITRTNTSQAIGNFLEFGITDTLKFSIGIEESLNTVAPDNYPLDYPLNAQQELMYWNVDSGYIFNHLSFTRDTITGSDTLQLNIGLNPRRIDIELPYADTLLRAENLTITLEVNYLEWFEGIDFVGDTEEEMLEKIVNNTSKAFQIKE